ncbi:hypothetical protein [Sphingomonas astaxanthinifaciens]|nr:hypothetical protein [Sphingomonas astaxanthinifaciens]
MDLLPIDSASFQAPRPVRRPARAAEPESDVHYFRRRAEQERRLAMAALDPQARARHRELAERYAGLVAAMIEAEDKLG